MLIANEAVDAAESAAQDAQVGKPRAPESLDVPNICGDRLHSMHEPLRLPLRIIARLLAAVCARIDDASGRHEPTFGEEAAD